MKFTSFITLLLFLFISNLYSKELSFIGLQTLNIDDPKLAELAARLEQSDQAMITIGHCPEADIRIDNLRFTATGQEMRFTYEDMPRLVNLPLRGKFQAENVLMAAALVIAAGGKALT